MRWRDALLLVGTIGLAAAGMPQSAPAQPLNKLPPARAPCTVLSAQPCHPSFCDVFHRGSCFPQYEAPIGEDFRLTIVTTDDDDAADQPGSGTAKIAGGEGEDRTLGTVGAMYAALRACWVPPSKASAKHGMQYTVRFAFKRDGDLVAPPFVTYASHDAAAGVRDAYRDAVNAAITRCTPLHFSHDMAEAVVGHPIAVRFVDERTVNQPKSMQ